ncbi:MAG: VOC family protein [Candidatus Melainabacteria bacterium]
MSKITPCLFFDGQAEEAVRFYTSIFENSRVLNITHYGEDSPGEAGSVMTIHFELDGQLFMALNGGPMFQFSEAISLMVDCETQAEADALWTKLTEGGEENECGWLTDRFGVSWQIVPRVVSEALLSPDPALTDRVVKAVWTMSKPDVSAIKQAAAGVVK